MPPYIIYMTYEACRYIRVIIVMNSIFKILVSSLVLSLFTLSVSAENQATLALVGVDGVTSENLAMHDLEDGNYVFIVKKNSTDIIGFEIQDESTLLPLTLFLLDPGEEQSEAALLSTNNSSNRELASAKLWY